MSRKLVIASRNEHKVVEIKDMLKDLKFEVLSISHFSEVPAVIEDGDTFEENAIKKAKQIANEVNCLALADDSGLEVEALNGSPGIYSARYAGEPSDDDANNKKLLNELQEIPMEKRKAQFKCVIAIVEPKGTVHTCLGVCQGYIGFEPQGEFGFGYDSLFIVPQYNQTFAQLGDKIKNKISHRAKALTQAKIILQNMQTENNIY